MTFFSHFLAMGIEANEAGHLSVIEINQFSAEQESNLTFPWSAQHNTETYVWSLHR